MLNVKEWNIYIFGTKIVWSHTWFYESDRHEFVSPTMKFIQITWAYRDSSKCTNKTF